MGSFGLTEYEPLERVPQSHTTATAGRFSSRRNCSDNRGCLGTASASSCSDSRSCRDRFDQSCVLPVCPERRNGHLSCRCLAAGYTLPYASPRYTRCSHTRL